MATKKSTDVEIIELLEDMNSIVDRVLEIRDAEDGLTRLEPLIIQTLLQITECSIFIREYTGHGFFGMYKLSLQFFSLIFNEAERMTLSEGYQKICAFRDVLSTLKHNFNSELVTKISFVSSRTHQKVDTGLEFICRWLLPINEDENLRSVIDLAQHLLPEPLDSSPRRSYTPGTCHAVASHLTRLLLSTSNRNIFWIVGPPRCGKSSISHTLAGYFSGISRLGAYLHFHTGASTPNSVLNTIVYQLATFDSILGQSVTGNVKHKLGKLSIATQFEEFFLKPLTAAATSVTGPVIIILDGLDESGPPETIFSLMDLFSSEIFSLVPRNFRFVITTAWDYKNKTSLPTPHGALNRIFLGTTDDHVSYVLQLNEGESEMHKEISTEKDKDVPSDHFAFGISIDSFRGLEDQEPHYAYVCLFYLSDLSTFLRPDIRVSHCGT